MFGLFEGLFGLIRPGILGNPREDLNSSIVKLESIPSWSMAVGQATGSPKNPQILAAEFEDLLDHIKSTKDTVSVTLVRRYAEMVDQMLNLAANSASEPALTPAQAPALAPEPPMPTPTLKSLPPAPPGLKCPHYTQASAFPMNWNDSEAEQRYLIKYPDVKNWVETMKKRKDIKADLNALWHYRCYGAGENRTWAGLDGIRSRIPGYLD